jgi:DNA-binding NarL/FixJ family response regulator
MRVALAEDSLLLREGLARLLTDSGFEVVAQSSDAEDLLRKVGAHKPDLAIVDVRMPPTNTDEGIRAALIIRERHPDTAVLVLSEHMEPVYALELFANGTDRLGYLSRDAYPTSTASSKPSNASGPAAPSSTPKSSAGYSAANATTIRSQS